jgi:hypothetical protein
VLSVDLYQSWIYLGKRKAVTVRRVEIYYYRRVWGTGAVERARARRGQGRSGQGNV